MTASRRMHDTDTELTVGLRNKLISYKSDRMAICS